MNKRGQFFLVAALVIIGIIIGLTTTYNFITSSKTRPTVYDLSNEIGFEGNRVLDYGIYNSQDTQQLVQDFARIYSISLASGFLIFFYGDESSMKYLIYNETDLGSIAIGNSVIPITGIIQGEPKPAEVINKKVKVIIDNRNYEFTLKEGENFFIIVEKEKGEETFIATNRKQ